MSAEWKHMELSIDIIKSFEKGERASKVASEHQLAIQTTAKNDPRLVTGQN